jgi:acyl-coenzyme A thioesterase PaaI-like protein
MSSSRDPSDEELTFPADGGCFGCSAANPHGLQMRFRRRGDAIVAHYAVAERFHGAPGIAHGGIVAAMMDEISCAAAVFVRDQRVVTGELSVRYRRPCPVERPLELEARVTGEHPRYLVIEADLRRDGEMLAHSTGKFFFARDATTSSP